MLSYLTGATDYPTISMRKNPRFRSGTKKTILTSSTGGIFLELTANAHLSTFWTITVCFLHLSRIG